MGLTQTVERRYTLDEVTVHGYIIAHGKVYDVTSLKNHPGGQRAIDRYRGTDCTYHYDFHTKNGRKIWEQYYIGRLNK